MTEGEWVAVITTVGVICSGMLAMFGYVISEQIKARRHSAVAAANSAIAAAEVKPDHGSSMRDAIDRNENLSLSSLRRLDRVDGTLDRIERAVHGLADNDTRQDHELLTMHTEQRALADRVAREGARLSKRMDLMVAERKAVDGEHEERIGALEDTLPHPVIPGADDGPEPTQEKL